LGKDFCSVNIILTVLSMKNLFYPAFLILFTAFYSCTNNNVVQDTPEPPNAIAVITTNNEIKFKMSEAVLHRKLMELAIHSVQSSLEPGVRADVNGIQVQNISIAGTNVPDLGYIYYTLVHDGTPVSYASTLQQVGKYYIISPDATTHSCRNQECSACGFSTTKEGEIRGCKCEEAEEESRGSCNHSITATN
jgi:hypothetical protein